MTIDKAITLSLRSISESAKTSIEKIESESDLYKTYLETIKKQLTEDFMDRVDLDSFVPEISGELKVIDIFGEVIAKLKNAYSTESVTESNEATELLSITLNDLRGNKFDDYKLKLKKSAESDDNRFKVMTINTNIEHIIDSYENLQSLTKVLVELDEMIRRVIKVA